MDVVTPLNSPNAAVVKDLKRGALLTVAIETNAKNVKLLVAQDSGGRIAGSLTPPGLVTIIACIEKGYRYGATVLDSASGGNLRVRIQVIA